MTAREIYDKQCPSFLQRLIYFESKERKMSTYYPGDFTPVLLVLSYLSLRRLSGYWKGENKTGGRKQILMLSVRILAERSHIHLQLWRQLTEATMFRGAGGAGYRLKMLRHLGRAAARCLYLPRLKRAKGGNVSPGPGEIREARAMEHKTLQEIQQERQASERSTFPPLSLPNTWSLSRISQWQKQSRSCSHESLVMQSLEVSLLGHQAGQRMLSNKVKEVGDGELPAYSSRKNLCHTRITRSSNLQRELMATW